MVGCFEIFFKLQGSIENSYLVLATDRNLPISKL